MPRKGGKNCCCDACYHKPLGQYVPAGVDAIWLAQQYCCACVPNQLCVSITCAATGEVSTTLLDAECKPSVEGELYKGTLPIQGAVVDVAFAFKIVSGICYLTLKSTVLGYDGSAPGASAIVIDATARAKPNWFCQSFSVDHTTGTKWSKNAMSCTTLTVQVSAPANDPINGRQPCLDAYGLEVMDTDPIKNICTGCGCICDCVCFILRYNGTVRQVAACRGNADLLWTSVAPAIEMEIGANTDGSCNLDLTQYGGITLGSTSGPVNISSSDPTNPCPRPHPKWSGFDNVGKAWFIEAVCQDCSGCANAPSQTCCNEDLPRVITATIAGAGFCSCANGTVSLVWDDANAWWYGESAAECNGQTMKLTFACGGGTWGLTMDFTPCVVSVKTAGAQSCLPLSSVWNFTLGGISCCGTGHAGGTMTVTVTE